MDKEVTYLAHLIIEIIVAAALLAILAPMCALAHRAYAMKLQDEGNTAKMEIVAELFEYNGKYVSYDDALELIMTKLGTLDYEFATTSDFSSNSYVVNVRLSTEKANAEGISYLKYWDYDKVAAETDGYRNSTLYSTLITSSDGLQITGVRFLVIG